MLNAAETNQAVPVGASATTGNRSEEVDGDAFTRALSAKMAEAEKAMEKVSRSLEKLASAFPGVTITTRSMATFGEVAQTQTKSGDSASLDISPEIMAEMADDEELFNRIKDMVSGLFGAGSEQRLVNAGGQSTHRNVSIEGLDVRYAEVQRTAGGTQLSVSSLTLQTEQMVSETLDQMLATARQQIANRSGAANTTANRGFEGFVNSSSAWRFQSFISSQSLDRFLGANSSQRNFLTPRDMLDQQMLVTSQSITMNLEIMLEQWQTEGGEVDLWSYMQVMGLSDPLVFDLGGEGINLRGPEDGVYFDIKGDGSPVKTAFIQGNNAFLYLDENGNGVADNANELFGDHGGFKNGFAKLAQYDDNGDGVIDKTDEIYSELRLWRDLNGDGINQSDESMTLAQAGIASINLNHDQHQALDRHGNVIGERSSFTRADGSQGLVADVWLRNL